MLRITGGTLKGQTYEAAKSYRVRPTSSMVREAIFNVVLNLIDFDTENSFLDIFSGTGGMGIEAVSRGFKNVYFVDNNRSSVSLIKKNTNKLALRNIKIISSNAINFLENTDLRFNVIFLDPPYDYEDYEELIIEARKKGDYIILEHKKGLKFDNTYKYKKWGDTAISIFLGE